MQNLANKENICQTKYRRNYQDYLDGCHIGLLQQHMTELLLYKDQITSVILFIQIN